LISSLSCFVLRPDAAEFFPASKLKKEQSNISKGMHKASTLEFYDKNRVMALADMQRSASWTP